MSGGMQDLLDRMCRRVLRHTDGMRLETPLPRVGIGVARQGSAPAMTLYQPMICVVLRGAKQVLIGDRVLDYGAGHCFVASLDLPATGCVVATTGCDPYIVASLALDRVALTGLLADLPPVPIAEAPVGFDVAPATNELLEAWDHMLAGRA